MSTLEGYVEGMINLNGGGGSGGGSDVSYVPSKESGTLIGKLTIDEHEYNLYCDGVTYYFYDGDGYKEITISVNDDPTTLRIEQKVSNMDDVYTNNLSDGDILKWDATDSLWVNDRISGGGVNYSLSEQNTGLTWVDGRPIYQKTYYKPQLPYGVSILDSNFTTSLYDEYWIIDTYWKYEYNGEHIVGSMFGGTGGHIYTELDEINGLQVVNYAGVDATDVYITIRYCKIEDSLIGGDNNE